ncbi:MAG: hypothetical protein QGF09_03485 [Rhodospirillales bacterium]|nr:hypothetical protein [Rhodospirillales bacterium]
MSVTTNMFENIGIEIQAALVPLYLPLAKILKERHGATLHLYTRSREDEKSFARDNKDGLWASVTNDTVHVEAIQAKGLDEEKVISRARQTENLIGEPINRLALSNRQMGHAFAAGAWHHPVPPYVTRASNTQLLHALAESVAFWEREIREKNLGLVMDGNKFMAATAGSMGVPYRRLTLARFGTYCYWAVNDFFDHPGIEKAYNALEDWPDAEIGGSYALAAQKYEIERHARSWWRIAVSLPESILRHFYYKARKMEKGDSIFLSDLITSPFRIRNAQRHLDRLATAGLEDLAGKTFVYYPLQKEPEATIGQAAPECLSQHATIIAVARDLPAGVLLAIKENSSAVGRRTASFYDQIVALKNVVMLHPDTPSIEAIKQAVATITIAGTASMEAAILGKPTLTFSGHIKWKFLPHARVVTCESELPSLLRWVASGPFDADQARQDGARFLAALKASSMNLKGFGRDRKGGYVSDEKDTNILYSALCQSLGLSPVKASRKKVA